MSQRIVRDRPVGQGCRIKFRTWTDVPRFGLCAPSQQFLGVGIRHIKENQFILLQHNTCIVRTQHISDAGFQDEITSVSTATHQIEVFSRVLRTSISSYLTKKHTNESLGELVVSFCRFYIFHHIYQPENQILAAKTG